MMRLSKPILRDALGLGLIISVALASLGILLDMLGALAYFSNEASIATLLFHESFSFLIFLIPPYFLAKAIMNIDLPSTRVSDSQRHSSQHEQPGAEV
ncbi:D-fructose-6-phosphate amidotransferase [Vibrio methylphosphonaticus]|uniref:D-fructose-6-phosphate amidotransferase n=1 Tax=Vibrio methylphosphonaticus TaxID=2946866 RepID=UPI002029C319|nr:D-fructose-6-phosphate amidotransferase [Vibrio methylphosphonaticus]MCL9775081.1 D-fructose-6-phosphate amidotransferase [Vibrio methylphosphonaticus]